MIGISMVPNLMVEEKQARTLDALMVSPAAPAHLVAGKAIAGLFYGLLGCIAVFALFGYLILQWWLAILAAILSVLLLVAVGLLLGSYVSGRAQLQLIGWFVILPLLLPVILVALRGLVPDGAIAVMEWIPTVLIATIFRLSLTPNVTFAHYGLPLLVVVASILMAFGLVVQLVRRQDRR
jgi:ABC-2 type transport system permease protein